MSIVPFKDCLQISDTTIFLAQVVKVPDMLGATTESYSQLMRTLRVK